MQVQGTVADVHGLGQNPPQQFIDFFNQLGVPLGTNAPIGTWFRNSGTTQYGGHAHIVMPAADRLRRRRARRPAPIGPAQVVRAAQQGIELAPNELKQLITMTAFDVDRPDTAGLGTSPTRRRSAGTSTSATACRTSASRWSGSTQDKIPPQALITSPEWFAPLQRQPQQHRRHRRRALSSRASRATTGASSGRRDRAAEADFQTVSNGIGPAPDRRRARNDQPRRRSAPRSTRASSPARPARRPPAARPATRPRPPRAPATRTRTSRPSPSASSSPTAQGNRGEDRKMLFAYRDATETYNKDIGTGGEASQRLWDIDGDNELDTVLADSSGELSVLEADGTPLQSFNNGQPVQTQLYPNVHPGAAAYGAVDPPREVLRTPAIGDIDGDLEPEIVDTAGEHVYAWNADGTAVPGLPRPARPGPVAAAGPHARTTTSSAASPARRCSSDLGPATASSRSSRPRSTSTSTPGTAAARRSPASRRSSSDPSARRRRDHHHGGARRHHRRRQARDRHADPGVRRQPGRSADRPAPAASSATSSRTCWRTCSAAAAASTRWTPAATSLPGWPTKPSGIVPDALPLVGPGVDHVMANVDSDPELEAIGNARDRRRHGHNGDGSNAVDLRLGARRRRARRQVEGPEPVREPDRGEHRRRRRARDHQGRRHAEPARQHRRRRRPEPALQPRRAGLERADRRGAAELPAGGRGLPAPVQPVGRRRLGHPRQRDPGRHRPLLPAQPERTRRAPSASRAGRSSPAAGSSRPRRSATPTATATSTSRP